MVPFEDWLVYLAHSKNLNYKKLKYRATRVFQPAETGTGGKVKYKRLSSSAKHKHLEEVIFRRDWTK